MLAKATHQQANLQTLEDHLQLVYMKVNCKTTIAPVRNNLRNNNKDVLPESRTGTMEEITGNLLLYLSRKSSDSLPMKTDHSFRSAVMPTLCQF